MPDFDVYLEVQANVFGTTMNVFAPYPANPVSGVDSQEAIGKVAVNLQGTYGRAAAGTYAAVPTGVTTSHTVTGFTQVPIFSA